MKRIDSMTEEELQEEEQTYAHYCGRYVASGYIERTAETRTDRPPSTSDWDQYMFFQQGSGDIIASCWAYNDDCARSFAEDNIIGIVDICLIRNIPFHAPGRVLFRTNADEDGGDDELGIGFTLDRDADGPLIEDAEFLESIQQIIDFLRERKLPDYMDEWIAWPDGGYYVGDQEIRGKVEAALDEFSATHPNFGLHIYVDYPRAWFKLGVVDEA